MSIDFFIYYLHYYICHVCDFCLIELNWMFGFFCRSFYCHKKHPPSSAHTIWQTPMIGQHHCDWQERESICPSPMRVGQVYSLGHAPFILYKYLCERKFVLLPTLILCSISEHKMTLYLFYDLWSEWLSWWPNSVINTTRSNTWLQNHQHVPPNGMKMIIWKAASSLRCTFLLGGW